jgi:Ni/Co efflux regulator RcnB
MKRLVLIGLVAAVASGCSHGPRLHAPHLRAPGHVRSPFISNASRYYEYGGRYYHRWREDWLPPQGYVDRQWQVGETLPPAFLNGSYRIIWNMRNLPRPGDDRQWVRAGKDAVLVEASGRIDLVIRNFYW